MTARSTRVSFHGEHGEKLAASSEQDSAAPGLAPLPSQSESYTPRLPALCSLGSTQHPSLRPVLLYVRKLLPTILAVCLGTILIVIKPVSYLSGDPEYSYLLLVVYTIYFFAGGHTIGRHLQTSSVGVAGACIGILWSALAVELGCIANRRAGVVGSLGGRVIPAVFLAAMAFIAAFIKSRYARLYAGCMLSIFVSIFLLGKGVGDFQITAGPFLGMLYPVLLAAGTSLVVVLVVWPTTANFQLAKKLVDAFGTSSELLLATLHLYELDITSTPETYADLRSRVSSLRSKLCSQVAQIQGAYDEAAFEIIFSYFPVHRFESFISTALQLQTLLVSRIGLHAGHEVEPRPFHVPAYLRKLVDELGSINLACLNSLRLSLAESSRLRNVKILDLGKNATPNVDKLRTALEDCMVEFQEAIAQHMDEALEDTEETPEALRSRLFQSHAFKDCFFVTCLLEISQDIGRALEKADSLIDHENKRRRLYFPAFSSAFVPVRYASNAGGQETEDILDEDTDEDDKRSQRYRSTAGMLFHAASLPLAMIRPHVSRRSRYCSPRVWVNTIRVAPAAFRGWLASEKMYERRARLHEFLAPIRHSRHAKYATKCALGISLLSLPGHLPFDSAGYIWHQSSRFPWASVAFLYCLQTTTAATFRDAFLRTFGTILGGVYAAVGQRIANGNPYALVAVMTFQAGFTGYIILMRPAYMGFGVVFQLTLPTVLFSKYLGIENPGTTMLALLRVQNIEIGIISALLLNILLWPYHAKVQLTVTCSKATDRLIKLYLSMSKQVLRKDHKLNDETRKRYEKLENATRLSLSRATALSQVVHLEASLLPKPITEYRQLIKSLDEALNLLSGLRSIRDHIPRKLVMDVLHERTELVSSILITMHAISHSLHNHSSVPQFLPDPRNALDVLVSAIEEQVYTTHALHAAVEKGSQGPPPPSHAEPVEAGTSSATTLVGSLAPSLLPGKLAFPSNNTTKKRTSIRRRASTSSERPSKLGFSFAFALAEHEAVSEIVAALEDTLETCRRLYGVASIIDQQDVPHVSLYIRSGAGTPTRSGARTPIPRTPTVRSAR